MSADTIATLGVGVTMLVAVMGGFAWMIKRTDAIAADLGARIDAQGNRIDGVAADLGSRIDGVAADLGSRIDAQGDRIDVQGTRIDAIASDLGSRIDAQGDRIDARLTSIEREIVEVKVAVARIEGPERRFLTAH